MMQKIFLTIVVLLFYFSVIAQTLKDPFYINYSLIPKNNFDSKNGYVTTKLVEINGGSPVINIGKKFKFINGLYYRNSIFIYSYSFSEKKLFPNNLHDIRYTAILRLQLNSKWEVIVLPRIMLRSDFNQSINSNDFFPQVALLAAYAIKGNPNFRIGFGVALNNDFARNAFVPLGSLFYDSKKIKIEILFPNTHFLYKYSENFEFGLFASVDGAILRITPFQLGSENANYLRTFQLLIAPTVSKRLYKNFFVHLKIGFVPICNYEAMKSNFEAIQIQNYNLKSNLFLRTGISFRFKN